MVGIPKKERIARLNQAIKETKGLLVKAKKRLSNSKKVVENTKAGVYGATNKGEINASKQWVKKDIDRVKELERHIKKLQSMK